MSQGQHGLKQSCANAAGAKAARQIVRLLETVELDMSAPWSDRTDAPRSTALREGTARG